MLGSMTDSATSSLGRLPLMLLLRGWLLCLVAAVVGGVWRGEDLAIALLGVLALLSVALVATPSILFIWYAVRHGAAAVPREMRRSAVGSGVSNLLAGVWIWTLPDRPQLFTAIAIALALLGAFVIGRVLTLGPADAAAATAPPLRHRGATLTGVVAVFLLVIGYAKTFGGHPAWGHASEATMTSDLKNLVAVQDVFFSSHKRYGSLGELPGFDATMSRATITVVADSGRFVATATSPETKLTCLVWTGAPAPPADSIHGAADGVPVCWEP
jgi:hypothetical protein